MSTASPSLPGRIGRLGRAGRLTSLVRQFVQPTGSHPGSIFGARHLINAAPAGWGSPAAPVLAGSYHATRFTITSPMGPVDLLAERISLRLELRPDGTTAGTLVVPGGSHDLSGTWDRVGHLLTLRQALPRFIRQMPLVAHAGELRGALVLPPCTIRLTLSKDAARAQGQTGDMITRAA